MVTRPIGPAERALRNYSTRPQGSPEDASPQASGGRTGEDSDGLDQSRGIGVHQHTKGNAPSRVTDPVRGGTGIAELAEVLTDTEVIIHSLNNLGTMEVLSGVPGGRERLERSFALARDKGFDEHAGRALIHLAWGFMRTRTFAFPERIAEGIEYCSERGLEAWRIYLIAYRARLELDQGRWSDARDSATIVLGHHRDAQLLRILGLVVLGLVRARSGEGGHWPLLDEALALALAGSSDELQRIAPVAGARAEAAWLEGNPTMIERETQAVFERALEVGDPWVIGEFAYWRWRAGVLDAAPHRAAEPFALQIAGQWKHAAERWAQIGCPYEAALALADADDESALRQSLDALQDLGARPAAAIVARRLRQRGIRGLPRGPRPSTRENPRDSPRERLRCWRSSAGAWAMPRSPGSSSSHRRPSSITSPRSCESWGCGPASRRPRKPPGSDCATDTRRGASST